MSLLKDLQGLNAAYAEVHASMQENQDKGYVVTAADKKGNTKAWQGYKSGVKSKTTGKPLYRAADHLKKEEANRESQLWDQVAANLTELHELRGVKYKVVPFSEHHQKDASGKVIEHGDATPSSLDEKKGAHAEMDRQRKAAKELHKPSVKKEGFSSWRDDLTEIVDEPESKAAKKVKESNVKNKVVIDPEIKLEQALGGKVETIEEDNDTKIKEEILWDRVAQALSELGEMHDVQFKVEGYQRNPEKGEAEAKKADKRSAKQKRMDSPDRGINSPAFKEFMRSRGM